MLRAHVAAVALLITFGLVAAACAPGEQPGRGATADGSPPANASPSPSPDRPERSPFTGRRGKADKPVLAVKFDNARAARPHTGLAAASLTYVEPVEGGVTRIMAVFAANKPKTVGPVRSVRRSDLHLLPQFGKPALAYSGAHPGLRGPVRRASLVPAGPAQVGGPYFRGSGRAPHNLYVHPKALLGRVSGVSEPRDIGFRFGPPPPGGKQTDQHTVTYRSARYTFHWSKGQERWLVSMDGSPAKTTANNRVGAATVVVQRTNIHPGKLRDPAGAISPVAETVGSGKAVVLRDGKRYRAKWKRPKPKAGTTFTTRSGKPMNFDRGPVWVLLAPRG